MGNLLPAMCGPCCICKVAQCDGGDRELHNAMTRLWHYMAQTWICCNVLQMQDWKKVTEAHKNAFAPPDSISQFVGGAHDAQPNEWTCDLIHAQIGCQCGQKFPSRRGMNIHQCTSLCHRGTRPVKGHSFAIANICPWCNKLFGNVNSAKRHVLSFHNKIVKIEVVHSFVAREMCVCDNYICVSCKMEMRSVVADR